MRILSLHELVRDKFLEDPAGVRKMAQGNLERWKARGVWGRGYAKWETILRESSDTEIANILVSATPRGDSLRHSTPFTGVVSEEQRKNVYVQYANQ